jgi:ADP-ribosylglycohydrolase
VLPTFHVLRRALTQVLADKHDQGHATDGLAAELAALPDSYDALAAFGERLAALPLRDDWPYVEPDDLDGIRAESSPLRPIGRVGQIEPADKAARRAHTAFLSAVCGCILGKPLEFDPSLEEIRAALEPLGAWPLRDYVPEAAIATLRYQQPQWPECVAGRIRWVAPDDDINYKVLGLLVLEGRGLEFTRGDLRDLWMYNLPVLATFGPERTVLLKAGLETMAEAPARDDAAWVHVLNPADEYCGALIRVDTYGYALPGRPALAAELAWRDAGFTHRRTGLYAAMFIAAAIALAPVVDEPLAMFEGALAHVPRRSRFAASVTNSLTEVAAAGDWVDGYERVRRLHPEHTHCRIYQEVGTLMNTLRFAADVGDGIGKQVCQGNDTDSFGATAGSLLGAWFGPDGLERRWLDPFNDRIHLALANVYEPSLSALAERVGRLPAKLMPTAPGGTP